jgi:hypothetical protein
MVVVEYRMVRWWKSAVMLKLALLLRRRAIEARYCSSVVVYAKLRHSTFGVS